MEHISEHLPSYREEQTDVICNLHGRYTQTKYFIDDVLVDTSPCPECHKIMEQKEKQLSDERRRLERIERRLANSNISTEYLEKTFQNFNVANKDDERVLDIAMRYFNNWEKVKEKGLGLLFYGSCGTGKSHLASAILHSLITDKDTYGQIWNVRDLLERVRQTWSEYDSSRDDVLSEFRNMPLLIIDELGVQSGTENERDVLHSIIAYRVANKKNTILITNLNLKDLLVLLGDRLLDRITSACIPVRFKGTSKRRKVTEKDLPL